MLKYLENLRQKPEAERRRAVFWISAAVTALIFILWAISLGMRMNAGDFTFKNSTESDASIDTSGIRDTISSFWAQLSGGASSTSSQ